MANINILPCDTRGANLKKPNCIREITKDKAVIFAPIDTVITADDAVNILAYLEGKLTADNPAERFALLTDVMVNENQSSDVERFTYPNGSTKVTRDTVIRMRYEHEGGFCVQNQLREGYNYAQGQYGWFTVDANRNLRGTNVYDSNGTATGVRPYRGSEIFVQYAEPAMEDAPARYYFELQWQDPEELNRDAAFIKLDFPVTDLPQMGSAYLGLIAWVSGSAGTANISVLAGCGSQNLVSLYPTALPDVTNFVATNYSTGNPITITAVTKVTVSGQDALLFDFDSSDPDYPTAGNNIILAGAAPSVLSGNDVEWYEIPRIILTRPA